MKTKTVWLVYDKKGLYINQFTITKPEFPPEKEYQVFEIEVNVCEGGV